MAQIKVLVFDVDDTLYEELTFVRSGFRAVAHFLEEKYILPREKVYEQFVAELEKGGEKIFDSVLRNFDLNTKDLVRKCLSVYRRHKPEIFLYKDAAKFLKMVGSFPIYIVTDGNPIVQKNKVDALLSQNRIKKVFLTRRFGIKNEKPSPYCFEKIQLLENVAPEEIVYVGDNPNKDFVGIKPLGFRTVRILRGKYKDLRLDKEHEAEIEIKNFDELADAGLGGTSYG
jgi:putative hydrolase of the HAD superfamily